MPRLDIKCLVFIVRFVLITLHYGLDNGFIVDIPLVHGLSAVPLPYNV
jgi:hypothetical protein